MNIDNTNCEISIRPVEAGDLEELARFITPFVDDGKLLPRTTGEFDDLLPNGFVAIQNAEIVGFAALEVYSKKLAEIRSLAVSSKCQGRGVGKQLVDACVERSREHDVLEVMAITSSEDFFKNCGFDFTLPGEKKALFKSTRSG